MTRVRRILFVELLGGFGDLLLALPAVHALARTWPEARVTVVTFAPGDVLVETDPHVAHVVTVDDHAEGAPRAAVEAELRRTQYDLAVTTTTYDGIADVCRLGARWAVTDLWCGAPPDDRVDRRFLRLLIAAGAVAPAYADLRLRVHLDDAARAAGRAVLRAVLPYGVPVVLVPEAGMPVKQWPVERWAHLAEALQADGHAIVAATASGCSPVPGVPGLPPCDLRALAAVLAAVGERGGRVVGGDTGPVRLATAVGTAAVALYGPTATGRYGLDPRLGVSLQGLPYCPVRLPSSISEQECWWTACCPLSDHGPACMADLDVPAVVAAVAAAGGQVHA